jgi:flagellar hook-basal body complex protein FliE
MAIQGIGGELARLASTGVDAPERSGGESFADAVTRTLRAVNQDQVDAAREAQALVVDGTGSVHEAMVAMSKAEGSFRLAMEIRNRLIDGINRLLQTQM